MFYKGRLRVAGDPGEGIPVDLSLDDVYVDLRADGEQLGRWRMDVVEAARLEGNDFRLLLDGEDMIFRAADPLGFAYNAVTTIEEISSRLRKRRRGLFRRKTGEPDLIRGVPLEEEIQEPKPTSVSAERIKDLGSLLPPAGGVERPPPTDGLFDDFDVDIEEDIASVSFGTEAVVMPESQPAEPIVVDPSVFGNAEDVEAFDPGVADAAVAEPHPTDEPAVAAQSHAEPAAEAVPFDPGLDSTPDVELAEAAAEMVEEVETDQVFDPADIAESAEIEHQSDPEPAHEILTRGDPSSEEEAVGDQFESPPDGQSDTSVGSDATDVVPMDAGVESAFEVNQDVDEVIEDVEVSDEVARVEAAELVEEHERDEAVDLVEPIEAVDSEGEAEPIDHADVAAPIGTETEPEAEQPEPLGEAPVEVETAPSDEGGIEDGDVSHVGVFDRTTVEDEEEEAGVESVAVAPPPPSVRPKRRLFGRSRGDQQHDHEYLESKTVGGITRRVCSVCGHVSFAGEDLYEGWK